MNRELLLAEWRRSVRALAAARLLAREAFVARIRRHLLDNGLTDSDLESGIANS